MPPSPPHVTAKYRSPAETHTFNPSQLSASSSPRPPSNGTNTSREQQSQPLHSLRSSVTKLQADINTFLTQKMEEDKGAGKAEDAKEEENYGEEIPDEGEDEVKTTSRREANVK